MKIPHDLDPVEIRVLGALLEKEQTTPEYYPLTLNALVTACNQRSNRDPVMSLSEADVLAALDRLHDDVLVWPVQGARVDRWRQNLDRRWELEPETKAVMTLLMLRGAQTPGELRGRSSRLLSFTGTDDVEAALELLAGEPDPLVVLCARRPGQKEARWGHLLAGPPADSSQQPAVPKMQSPANEAPQAREAVGARVQLLEEKVEALELELSQLRQMLEQLTR